MRFLLFAGANNSLASSEINTQIPHVEEKDSSLFVFSSDSIESAISVVSKLGSSVKLAVEQLNVLPEAESIADLIKAKNFSVTDLESSKSSSQFSHALKGRLTSSRFILANDQFGLSPVIHKKHKVDEFFVDLRDKLVWKTVWVHDFRHWIQKDRHMPFANARAGMLPPKIARSMVNCVPLEPQGKLLVDPFCGSGRVLVEAAELGYRVIGADISEEQCQESRKNLQSLNLEAQIMAADATHISEVLREPVDAIVTEPFLGKPNPRPDQIKYLVPGLMKLYLGALKDWLKILKPGGYVVMVFPSFFDGKKIYKTSDVVDGKLEQGYNIVKRGILYSRPDADIKREIVILQKK